MIHFAEIYTVIKVKGGEVTYTEEGRFLCGAEEGEGDTRRRLVTCPDCRELLVEIEE